MFPKKLTLKEKLCVLCINKGQSRAARRKIDGENYIKNIKNTHICVCGSIVSDIYQHYFERTQYCMSYFKRCLLN